MITFFKWNLLEDTANGNSQLCNYTSYFSCILMDRSEGMKVVDH